MREVAKPVQRCLDLLVQASQKRLRLLGMRVGEVSREPQLNGKPDEVLLCAVVEIALDPPTLGICRQDDTGSRCSKLLDLLVDARLQRSVPACKLRSL